MFRWFKWLFSWWNHLKNGFTSFSTGSKWWPWKWNPFKAIFRFKTWLFLRPRALKILLSVKTWLVLGLGASNLFVLSFVLNIYLQSGGITLYSTVATENLVKRECEEEIERVLKGRAESQVCRIEMKQRHKGAKYTENQKYKIKKEGSKLVITVEENVLTDRNKHAEEIEGTFCEGGCDKNEDLTADANALDVMKAIVAMAEKQEEAVKDRMNEAREEYEKARISERVARVKQRRCEGYWDEDEEMYEEYDTEERLDCKMARMVGMSSIQKDRYYRDTMTDEFWNIALDDEEDPYFIIDHLSRINSSSHFSLNSRVSAGLIRDYVGWRDRYEDLDNDYQRDIVINQLVRNASGLAGHLGEQGQKNFLHLRTGLDRHFDMAGARLNSVITHTTPTHTPASHTPTTTSPINQQTLDLY